MKSLLIISLFAILLMSCSTSTQTDQKTQTAVAGKNDALAKLFENYYEERLQLFPLEATQQGDNRYNDLLPVDISKEFIEKTRQFYQDNLTNIQAIDRESLSEEDKIAYDTFKREMEVQLEGFAFHPEYIPFQQFWGLPLTFGQLGSGESIQPFKTVKDYEDWLKRMSAFTIWGDSAIVNFRKGIEAGVVLPKSLVEKMIPQMNDLLVKDANQSLFYSPINKFPADFSEADKTRLTVAYKKAILEEIVPTYQKLGNFLQKEYLAKARTSSGINELPQGKEMYAYQVKVWTTTDKTPDEIYETGKQEVARIRSEMEKVKEQVGFKGTLNDFFAHLKKDKQFYPYSKSGEVLADFNAILAKIEPNLKKMFNKTPQTKFEVRQTEKFREASASAEYNPGAPDGSRPGIFYVPIPNANEFNKTSGMESLFLHEAIPGHHYQISLQQENENLYEFQRFSWYGAYGEGWALYCESLGKELGLYTDPYQYMGALGDEMHRAIRLVVDVGLHTKGMSREEAIKYMMDNEPISEQGATAEIERYMAIPGQALSYKIGALKIRELREKYEKQLGNKFNLSEFHDEFLKDGGMPLDVLETKMDAWAAKQANKQI
ncbi:DUF885 domain-containing protein [Rhodocytophaga rosea]|uniref:DUF885 domain-containing protein n=1 Tax=Rhodocytophaga rosea TaxID=2704465 RepID=A0A6C0GV26_9BACT|nr:DUF885 domain-containing protein [Rhodocytophaga rosea]QHT71413.1 DUF885 domain-containing protein [Rhodocytophaga rosea]